jgi:hypothetical protein
MGHRAAIAIGSCAIGLAVMATPVDAVVGGSELGCGPALLTTFGVGRTENSALTGEVPVDFAADNARNNQQCFREGAATVFAGLVLAAGGSLAAAALGPARNPH